MNEIERLNFENQCAIPSYGVDSLKHSHGSSKRLIRRGVGSCHDGLKPSQMIDFWDCEIKSSEIICPYCNTKQDQETLYHYVSYWGEDSDRECCCEHCGKEFLVFENVKREFGTNKKEEDLE